MSKTYYARFGSGDCRLYSGLTPTFLIFSQNGSAITPPAISEIVASSGIYSFTYGTTTPIAFLLDGFTTGLLGANRYVTGSIDPADRADEYGNTLISYGLTSIALGTTNVALGTTNVALGTTNVALGTTNVALGQTSVGWGAANSGVLVTVATYGQTSVALGTTAVALGITTVSYLVNFGTSSALNLLIGSTASGYLPPVDLFGYMKRIQQDLEGDQTFTKSSGVLQFFDSTGATQLFSKTITNSASLVIRS